MTRRRFLQRTAAGAGMVALAGCGGGGVDNDSGSRATKAAATTQAGRESPGEFGGLDDMGRKRRRTPAPTPAPGTYSMDFTTAAFEDPLSAGNAWSNNTQGVGGNVPPLNMGSMRIALASDGVTTIAQHAAEAVVDYEDSFAFIPNVSANGNIRITAVVYRDPLYSPNDNHELELILGCATTEDGNHRWIECLWSMANAQAFTSVDGQPQDFTGIGDANWGGPVDFPADGDVWVAELYRSSNRVRMSMNGIVSLDVTDTEHITGLGSGAGIAAFRRPGDTNSGGLGFRSFKCETF